MSLRCGVPQDELLERFTVRQLRELVAYQEISDKRQTKDDVRTQFLAHRIVNALSSKPLQFEDFEIVWVERETVIDRKKSAKKAWANICAWASLTARTK